MADCDLEAQKLRDINEKLRGDLKQKDRSLAEMQYLLHEMQDKKADLELKVREQSEENMEVRRQFDAMMQEVKRI